MILRALTVAFLALLAATGQALAGASVLTVTSLTPAGIAAISIWSSQQSHDGNQPPLFTCNPTTANPTCAVPGLSDGQTPYFVVGTNAGYNVVSGTGMCAGISGPTFAATVPPGNATCGIQTSNAPVVLNVTAANPRAINVISVYKSYNPATQQTGPLAGTCAPTVAQPTCVITGGLAAGDNPYFVVDSTIGYGIVGGSQLCAAVGGSPFTVNVAANGVYTCGLNSAVNVLSVTSLNPAGIASIQVYKGYNASTKQPVGTPLATCTPTPSAPNCSVAGLSAGDQPYFVLGVNANYGASGGTGLCTGVSGTSFQLAALPVGGGWVCGLNSVTQPQNGWWYANDGSTSGYAFQLDSTSQYLYGVAFTYRTDGTPVWYAINAMANASNVYMGTAAEFVGGGTLAGGTASAARLKSIVANVQLAFKSGSAGTLTWTSRPAGGGPATVTTKALQRYPINGQSVLPAPANAPTTGWYQGNQFGTGYFLELQGTSSPQAHIGIYTYDGNGNATWNATGSATAVATTGGWQVNTPLYSYSGGAPLTAPPVGATATSLGTIIANLSPTTNTLTLWNGLAITLQPYTGFGKNAGNWLQIVNNNGIALPNPWISFNSPNNLVSFVDTTTNAFVTVQANTSYQLSRVANGSFFINATGIGGRVFVSAQAMSFPDGALPSPTNPNDPNYKFRWQFLEVGGDYDLSFVDLYSIPMAFNQGALTFGAATSAQLGTFVSTLKGLTTTSGAAAQYDSTNSLVRIISPAESSIVTAYPSLSTYIGKTNFAGLTISDSYNGVAPDKLPPNAACAATAYAGQAYATTSITYDGASLTITGNTTVAGQNPVPFTIVASKQTSVQQTDTLTAQAFSSAIYMGEMDYSVTSSICATTTKTENNGANDVFSVVIRDILAGFSVGYVGSSAYGGLPSSAWWSSNTIFGGLQPGSTTAAPLYNPWAAAVYALFQNQVYGFQYSDHFTTLGSPLVSIQPGSPLQLILLNERN